ncbi:iron complex transport system permease protein [Methanomicrobium sp. W14]|uniref:FecCD family ABC transporter permease n=1 Tax=Methanomicrobium sp. W14 TaxID=2817839 RepID=UPI001FDA85EF|nr:iron chelate uptake ABC transporter family permease subunit [Methanomicrobium sp. W14]MBP2133184.1 iron complex transport system permease protein [Methanomicrobium sp. W14]
MYKRRNAVIASAGLFVLTLAIMLFSTGVGESNISTDTVLAILLSPITGQTPFWSVGDQTIIMDIRLPRILLGALVGISLALSGAALQSLFKNPMADPFILGISNGAALGATIVFVYGSTWIFSFYSLPAMAFIFGLATIFLVYYVARVGNTVPVNTLLLSGIAISALFSAVNSFIMFTGGQNLQQIMFWTMGGLSGRGWDYVWIMLPFSIAGIIIMLYLSRQLNAMMFGEESAQYLGIEVEKLKKILLVTTALITSAAVSVSGIIGFVGLIIPHIVRLLTGPDHRILIPVSVFAGAIFIVVADMLARIIIAPAELPLGVITALCGAPFFLYLLRSKRGEL